MPVTDRNDLDAAIRREKDRVVAKWDRYEGARAYLADHRPYAWQKVRTCRLGVWHTKEDENDADRVKIWPHVCHQEPWCVECVSFRLWERTKRVRERWQLCTPKGEEPLFRHIVITAPIYHSACPRCRPEAGKYEGSPDPECDACGGRGGQRIHPASWGMEASRNPRAFMEVVWRTLKEMYGAGIGAHMSYQDFGEAGLARRHPHIDLTLNGWVVKTDACEELPFFDLADGGRDRMIAIVERHAQALRIGASGTSPWLGKRAEGFPRYIKELSYQIREMVDLRKMQYDRTQQMVGWESYKAPYETTWMAVRAWDNAFAEYCARLKQFNGKGGRKLHWDFGHMESNNMRKTKLITRGTPEPHPEGCSCNECGSWRRVFIQADDSAEWRALASPYDA